MIPGTRKIESGGFSTALGGLVSLSGRRTWLRWAVRAVSATIGPHGRAIVAYR